MYQFCASKQVTLRLKCDGTRAETRFRLSAKRTSPFKSAGASVHSTTGRRGVRISGSNGGYTMFRGSVKSTVYPLHSPVSPSLSLPASPWAITFQLDSTISPKITSRVLVLADFSLYVRYVNFSPLKQIGSVNWKWAQSFVIRRLMTASVIIFTNISSPYFIWRPSLFSSTNIAPPRVVTRMAGSSVW